jgi:arsenate reductase
MVALRTKMCGKSVPNEIVKKELTWLVEDRFTVRCAMIKSRVIIICTRNSARSQMVEAFLRQYAGDRFKVTSAGLDPQPIHRYTIAVMREIGYNLRDHYSKSAGDWLGYYFRYIITVCAEAEQGCPIFPGISTRLYWPFEDPAAFEGTEEERLHKFREVRDQIDARVQAWLRELGYWTDKETSGMAV